MALKDLTTPTFISLLDGWTSPKWQRGLIEKLARSGTLLPDLESSREALGSSHTADGKAPPALAKAQQKCAALDGGHDRKARGLDKVLDGLSELTDDDELAAALQAARAEVLGPAGAGVVRWSYTDEAANAHLADERISPETKTLLADVKVGDRVAAKWVKDWQSVAQKLGEAEAERAAIEAAPTKGQTPADAVRARNQAIRVINAFRGMLDLDAPDEATRAAILGPLLHRRVARHRALPAPRRLRQRRAPSSRAIASAGVPSSRSTRSTRPITFGWRTAPAAAAS